MRKFFIAIGLLIFITIAEGQNVPFPLLPFLSADSIAPNDVQPIFHMNAFYQTNRGAIDSNPNKSIITSKVTTDTLIVNNKASFNGIVKVPGALHTPVIAPLGLDSSGNVTQDSCGINCANFSQYAWGLTGNAGTNIRSNYIGTADNTDLNIDRFTSPFISLYETNLEQGVSIQDTNSDQLFIAQYLYIVNGINIELGDISSNYHGTLFNLTSTSTSSLINIISDTTTQTGKFAIIDGSQGVGKVLTSDANGNASWQSPGGAIQVHQDSIHITSAQLLASNVTAVQLEPGIAGHNYQILSIREDYNFLTSAYTTASAGLDVTQDNTLTGLLYADGDIVYANSSTSGFLTPVAGNTSQNAIRGDALTLYAVSALVGGLGSVDIIITYTIQ